MHKFQRWSTFEIRIKYSYKFISFLWLPFSLSLFRTAFPTANATQVTELFQILLIHVLMGEYKLFKVAVNPYYFATLKLFKSGNKYKWCIIAKKFGVYINWPTLTKIELAGIKKHSKINWMKIIKLMGQMNWVFIIANRDAFIHIFYSTALNPIN